MPFFRLYSLYADEFYKSPQGLRFGLVLANILLGCLTITGLTGREVEGNMQIGAHVGGSL